MFPLALNTFGDLSSKHRVMLKVILLSVVDQILHLGWSLFGAAKELALYLGTAAGPTLFLVAIICSNLYLLFVPVISTLIGQSETYDEAFKKARVSMAWVWSVQAEKFFGYQVKGFDKIPDKGGAVIVYYHGPIPVDYFFLVCQTLLRKGRLLRSVVDRVLINVPGFEMVGRYCGAHVSTRDQCTDMLKRGHLIGVAPGGGYECQLGTHQYPIMWKKRAGFAHIAINAGVPIIPVFTENIREAFVTMETGGWLWRFIFDNTKIPMTLMYGGFPVKLTSYVGDPIYPTPDMTAEELRVKTIESMQGMINQHQKIMPGSIVPAVSQNLFSKRKSVINSKKLPMPHNKAYLIGPPQPPKVKLDVAKPEDLIVRNIESTKLKIFKELRELLEADQQLVLSRQAYDPDDVLDPVQKLHQILMRHNEQTVQILQCLARLKGKQASNKPKEAGESWKSSSGFASTEPTTSLSSSDHEN